MPSTLTRQKEIDLQFKNFHSVNPQVYETLVQLARKAKNHGATKIGIEYIFNIARWELMLQTKSDTAFRLNNNFKSRYSRLIMENELDLEGFFSTREQNAS